METKHSRKKANSFFVPIFSSISWWHWWLRSRILAGYRWHPGFQYRIQDAEEWHCNALHLSMFSDVFGCFWYVQDFRVSMGFGLHHGWAIEAPVEIWLRTKGCEVIGILAFVTFASGRERLAVSTRSMPPICRPMSVWPQSWRHRSVPSIPGVIMVVIMWNIMKQFRCPVEFVDCIAVARLLLRSSKFGCFCPIAWPLGKGKISCHGLRLSSFAMFHVCMFVLPDMTLQTSRTRT